MKRKTNPRARRAGAGLVVLCLALGVSIAIATAAAGKDGGGADSVGDGLSAQASATINTPGPLTNIYLSDELNCQVDHLGDASHEFFGDVPGACATFIATGGTLYGPTVLPAGGAAMPRTPYTVVSQTGVTGAGTPASPYTVVSVVDAGVSGLRLTQTDSYIVGAESYRTDVAIANTTGAPVNFILYRAGDCFLQDSDLGFGDLDLATGSVSCRGSDDGITPNSRIERWVPRTGGSSAFEAGFNEVWAAIGSQTSFNDTCLCGNYIDNGAGLSWVSSVDPGGTETFTQDTIFSPTGEIAPFITKAAALDEVAAGGQNSYTVTVFNPLGSPVSINTITDHLPAGFAYIPGTTAGGITVNPTVNGQDLTWTGPFDLPAGGTIQFAVRGHRLGDRRHLHELGRRHRGGWRHRRPQHRPGDGRRARRGLHRLTILLEVDTYDDTTRLRPGRRRERRAGVGVAGEAAMGIKLMASLSTLGNLFHAMR